MRHALLLLTACLCLPALAQQTDAAKPAAQSRKPADPPAEAKPVIQISRSTKPNCDVKPVMTDAEIGRCKKAWGR